eukprot:4700880-Lingulodinium_polyedra.AAC.1
MAGRGGGSCSARGGPASGLLAATTASAWCSAANSGGSQSHAVCAAPPHGSRECRGNRGKLGSARAGADSH